CHAKEIYGIEISEKGSELASKNGIKVLRQDIERDKIPLKDNYFDGIYAGEIIEHLFDTDFFLDEVFRVLKYNGIFVIDTPNLGSFYNRIALLFGYLPFDMQVSLKYSLGHLVNTIYKVPEREIIRASDHIRFFTVNALHGLLENHGFSVIKIYGGSDNTSIKNSLLLPAIKIIDNSIGKIPTLSRIIIVESIKK
ncbi:MAG: class I SAM-dependent methyltransferase, partial [Endomicrobiia bacterium]